MKKQYTKKQIVEAISYWKRMLESKLDLDDDLDMAVANDIAHADQNLRGFAAVFSGDISMNSPSIELVAKALHKSIDIRKLKDHIAMLKSLGSSSKSFKNAVHSLDSLVYFLKCMDELSSKRSLDSFEDDVY